MEMRRELPEIIELDQICVRVNAIWSDTEYFANGLTHAIGDFKTHRQMTPCDELVIRDRWELCVISMDRRRIGNTQDTSNDFGQQKSGETREQSHLSFARLCVLRVSEVNRNSLKTGG